MDCYCGGAELLLPLPSVAVLPWGPDAIVDTSDGGCVPCFSRAVLIVSPNRRGNGVCRPDEASRVAGAQQQDASAEYPQAGKEPPEALLTSRLFRDRWHLTAVRRCTSAVLQTFNPICHFCVLPWFSFVLSPPLLTGTDHSTFSRSLTVIVRV